MTFIFENVQFHMWFVILLTALAAISFTREKLPIEVTSVALLTTLLLFGQFFPVFDASGRNTLNPSALLSGFSNPALVAVLALLVMGQAIVQTDALRPVIRLFVASGARWAWFSIAGILVFIMAVSGFFNNTPLVILAIPILQALAGSASLSESRVMMPLSYAAILGGMTTLIGSSTNLLVSGSMEELGYEPLQFFDFIVPGMVMAGAGIVYILFILPFFLPERSSLTREFVGDEKEFVAELDIAQDSALIGREYREGSFSGLEGLNIRLIQRTGHLILPPFEGYVIEPGDILIVAATRKTLTHLLAEYPGFLLSDEQAEYMAARKSEPGEQTAAQDGSGSAGPELDEKVADTRILAEIMITPASRMIDMSLEQVGFHRQFRAIVLGIQRRARVVRRRLGRIRLEAGDVLLVAGSRGAIDAMRGNQDFIVLSGSKKELPVRKKAPLAAGVMISAVGLAALDIISIPVAAITGAALLVATDCLNVRQAVRAIDRKIFLLVGSMLALGTALQATGGSRFIAESVLDIPFADDPLIMASILFIVVAFCTNVLSNNVCAILFTPIAMTLALNMGVDPLFFAVTVIFAANCSFASPIGYQTNLLVMGPGHYRFRDFMKAGIPLILVLWVTFILLAKFYYGI